MAQFPSNPEKVRRYRCDPCRRGAHPPVRFITMAFKDKGSTAESVTATVRKGKLKKQARLEAMRKEKERTSRLREAATKRDLLDGYAAFRHYDRAGVEATLEGRHGCDIEESDVDACIALQRAGRVRM